MKLVSEASNFSRPINHVVRLAINIRRCTTKSCPLMTTTFHPGPPHQALPPSFPPWPTRTNTPPAGYFCLPLPVLSYFVFHDSTLWFTKHMAVSTHLRSNGATGSPLTRLLDLVLTDKLSTIVSTSTHPPIGSSDHLVVESVLSLKNPKKTVYRYKKSWCYDKADTSKLINDLQNAEWNNRIEAPNAYVDSATDFWNKTSLPLVNKHVPSKKLTSLKPKLPWITIREEQEIRLKHSLFRKYKKSGLQEDREAFCNRSPETRQKLCGAVRWYGAAVVQRVWRRRPIPETRVRSHLLRSLNLPVSSLAPDSNWIPVTPFDFKGTKSRNSCEKAEGNYTITLFRSSRSTSSDPRFWSYIRSVAGKTHHRPIPDLITGAGTTLQNDMDKANAFNMFFQKQADFQRSQPADLSDLPKNAEKISFLCTSPSEVYDILVARSAKEKSTWKRRDYNWSSTIMRSWYWRKFSHPI